MIYIVMIDFSGKFKVELRFCSILITHHCYANRTILYNKMSLEQHSRSVNAAVLPLTWCGELPIPQVYSRGIWMFSCLESSVGDSSVELEVGLDCLVKSILIMTYELTPICISLWFIYLSRLIFIDCLYVSRSY